MKLFANIYRLTPADLNAVITFDANGERQSDPTGKSMQMQTPIPGMKEKPHSASLMHTVDKSAACVKSGYTYEMEGNVWILPVRGGAISIRVGALEIIIGGMSGDDTQGDIYSVLSKFIGMPVPIHGMVIPYGTDPQV